jgi:hypothetical protein
MPEDHRAKPARFRVAGAARSRNLARTMSPPFAPPNPAEAEPAAPLHPEFLGHPTPLFTLFFAELWERFLITGCGHCSRCS